MTIYTLNLNLIIFKSKLKRTNLQILVHVHNKIYLICNFLFIYMAILYNYNQFLRVKYHQSHKDSVLHLGKRRKQLLEQSQVSLNCLLLNHYLLLHWQIINFQVAFSYFLGKAMKILRWSVKSLFMCIIFLFYTKIDLQVLYSLSLTKINALSNCTKVMIHAELLYDNDLTLELSITQFLLFL